MNRIISRWLQIYTPGCIHIRIVTYSSAVQRLRYIRTAKEWGRQPLPRWVTPFNLTRLLQNKDFIICYDFLNTWPVAVANSTRHGYFKWQIPVNRPAFAIIIVLAGDVRISLNALVWSKFVLLYLIGVILGRFMKMVELYA